MTDYKDHRDIRNHYEPESKPDRMKDLLVFLVALIVFISVISVAARIGFERQESALRAEQPATFAEVGR
jgi:hypothetical protein